MASIQNFVIKNNANLQLQLQQPLSHLYCGMKCVRRSRQTPNKPRHASQSAFQLPKIELLPLENVQELGNTLAWSWRRFGERKSEALYEKAISNKVFPIKLVKPQAVTGAAIFILRSPSVRVIRDESQVNMPLTSRTLNAIATASINRIPKHQPRSDQPDWTWPQIR